MLPRGAQIARDRRPHPGRTKRKHLSIEIVCVHRGSRSATCLDCDGPVRFVDVPSVRSDHGQRAGWRGSSARGGRCKHRLGCCRRHGQRRHGPNDRTLEFHLWRPRTSIRDPSSSGEPSETPSPVPSTSPPGTSGSGRPGRERRRRCRGYRQGASVRLDPAGRIVNVLCLSGIWCGDCVRSVPIVARLAEAAGLVR